jgi:plasmid stability protein
VLVQIRDVPDDVHGVLTVRAAEAGEVLTSCVVYGPVPDPVHAGVTGDGATVRVGLTKAMASV